MTKRMRAIGVQFHNRRNGSMFKVEHGMVYQLIDGHGWIWIPLLDENKLLADEDVYCINGGRNLAIVLAVSMCVVLGFAIWGSA